MTEEEENAFDKVKKGFKETADGVKEVVGGTAEVVEGTAQGVKEAVEDTAEGVKEGVEDTAEGVEVTAKEATDTDTYTKSYDQTENREYNKAGGNEPMNPEDIASHEPTAVNRDQDTGITEERQAGTDSAEAKEKYRKKGMTET
jgi:ElaB/YqjD/DUF883 family membrane-anchored ribosome-binding protein